MFKITEETKAEAVTAMKAILDAGVTDQSIGEAFDVAVQIVMKQFGM